jgi:hypothetical protein
MSMFIALLSLSFAQIPSSPARRDATPTTLTGCIQQTGDPNIFLLAVPGIGPPSWNPPAGAPAGQPVGRGGTDARGRGGEERSSLENRTYRLVDTDAARFKALVGRAVAVTGELLPSDAKPSARGTGLATEPPTERLRVTQVKEVAESCTKIIRGK